MREVAVGWFRASLGTLKLLVGLSRRRVKDSPCTWLLLKYAALHTMPHHQALPAPSSAHEHPPIPSKHPSFPNSLLRPFLPARTQHEGHACILLACLGTGQSPPCSIPPFTQVTFVLDISLLLQPCAKFWRHIKPGETVTEKCCLPC